ncbi:fibronectin type III domain-containing protein 7-like [Corythoichthys intestinalis]|uniref:fibronectin type III domain-containing protein 7-like n=1 Tax=Corythoichthys intestinalis TaxID=161448 RepID=UPI0025A61E8A|nr:fibronectin type III domain-containing protein 7-like [Corythoichthys intestinalis]XP_061791200.1 fibronectin type III domain-containing protein 7-like [Nerophis lumbriciformis]
MGALKGLVTLVLLCVFTQARAQTDFIASVFAETSRSTTLRWNRYPGASSYLITVFQQGLEDPIAFTQFGENIVMGTVNSLYPNNQYDFIVQPLDINQNSLATTNVQSLTAPVVMDPIQKVKPKDSQALIIEFNLVNGATHYIVRVQGPDGFFREDTVYSSPAEISSLKAYTEYTLRIMAGYSGGRNQPSPTVTGKTVLAPLQLHTSSPSNNSIDVSWDPIDSAVQYTVALYDVFSNTTMKQNTTSNSLTFSGLEAGSLFMIMGFGWDAEERKGEGSLYINQTTRPPMPSSVDVSVTMNNDQAELSVSWELNQEVYSNIEYYVTSDESLTCNTTSSPCTLSPVGCGEVYTIQVIAFNDAGPSYPSYPVEFITFPCPPKSLAIVESAESNCTLSWDIEPYTDSYMAYIKKGDGSEETCATTSNNCTYHCQCGYMFQLYVFAYNPAGSSPQGPVVNYTTLPCCPENVSVSLVSTETLEITWTASRGADLYETRAADISEVILCNDTAPVCALSDLSCDTAYSVVVTPCNDMSGCNRACKAHTKDTAPCMPMHIQLDPKNSSCVSVSWTANNRAANYSVNAVGEDGTYTCTSGGSSCDITDLPCGCNYEVIVTATSAAGQSLQSYSERLETEPCCPANTTVHQVTQAMTNVSWSHAKGAYSFMTSLTSSRGHASCHTQDLHCLMGCITCGTNYTVTMEAYSHSGRSTNCTYQGFSSSACCPSGLRVYKMAGNSLRLQWRITSSSHRYIAELMGSNNYYNCTTSAGESNCAIADVQCGDVYHVTVAPLTAEDSKVSFCGQRIYSVTCLGDDVGTVIYRGKRSLDESIQISAKPDGSA